MSRAEPQQPRPWTRDRPSHNQTQSDARSPPRTGSRWPDHECYANSTCHLMNTPAFDALTLTPPTLAPRSSEMHGPVPVPEHSPTVEGSKLTMQAWHQGAPSTMLTHPAVEHSVLLERHDRNQMSSCSQDLHSDTLSQHHGGRDAWRRSNSSDTNRKDYPQSMSIPFSHVPSRAQ